MELDLISATTIRQVFGIQSGPATSWAPLVEAALQLCDATSTPRLAAFLAQVGHESGCLRYTRELWGPTDQQKRYEPTTSLAGKLGNVHPGDGARYMGRGLIQTTGRANYAMTTVLLRKILGASVPDFEAAPDLLERPYWAAMSAGLYWRVKNLNPLADAHDMVGLTKRINGGLNGLAHRQALYTQALGALT